MTYGPHEENVRLAVAWAVAEERPILDVLRDGRRGSKSTAS